MDFVTGFVFGTAAGNLTNRAVDGACSSVAATWRGIVRLVGEREPVEMEIKGKRGEIYLRETMPGLLVMSWYPSSTDDPGWPGAISEPSMEHDFPTQEALAGDRDAVRRWLETREWWHPLQDD
jgi:hypothetical protein